jgi:hypothetical protein
MYLTAKINSLQSIFAIFTIICTMKVVLVIASLILASMLKRYQHRQMQRPFCLLLSDLDSFLGVEQPAGFRTGSLV